MERGAVEVEVIGYLLKDPDKLNHLAVQQRIEPSDFADPELGEIFSGMEKDLGESRRNGRNQNLFHNLRAHEPGIDQEFVDWLLHRPQPSGCFWAMMRKFKPQRA